MVSRRLLLLCVGLIYPLLNFKPFLHLLLVFTVFQLLRFEVHVRITDETGQHIQHMSTTANPAESFLFSSLFDGDNGVMVGGSNPLSEFCSDVGDPFAGTSTAEALLSSLCADDLCCGLMDDFVSRTAGKEEGIFLGFGGDWNVFVSSSDSSSSNETGHKRRENFFRQDLSKTKRSVKREPSEEDRSSDCGSEEDQNKVEFDSEESKALWESLSKSSDPYNPLFFSACISTNTGMGKSKTQARDGSDSDFMSVSKTSEKTLGPLGLKFWASRSDSESSWASSEDSSPDVDKEESERLWEFFSSPADPYNPMCFTACTVGNKSLQTTSTPVSKAQAPFLHPPPSQTPMRRAALLLHPRMMKMSSCGNLSARRKIRSTLLTFRLASRAQQQQHSSLRKVQMHLKSTTQKNSPTKSKKCKKDSKTLRRSSSKPSLPDRLSGREHHPHQDKTLVPWKRAGKTHQSPAEERKESNASSKKVMNY